MVQGRSPQGMSAVVWSVEGEAWQSGDRGPRRDALG